MGHTFSAVDHAVSHHSFQVFCRVESTQFKTVGTPLHTKAGKTDFDCADTFGQLVTTHLWRCDFWGFMWSCNMKLCTKTMQKTLDGLDKSVTVYLLVRYRCCIDIAIFGQYRIDIVSKLKFWYRLIPNWNGFCACCCCSISQCVDAEKFDPLSVGKFHCRGCVSASDSEWPHCVMILRL